jgi:hypothetical protein
MGSYISKSGLDINGRMEKKVRMIIKLTPVIIHILFLYGHIESSKNSAIATNEYISPIVCIALIANTNKGIVKNFLSGFKMIIAQLIIAIPVAISLGECPAIAVGGEIAKIPRAIPAEPGPHNE